MMRFEFILKSLNLLNVCYLPVMNYFTNKHLSFLVLALLLGLTFTPHLFAKSIQEVVNIDGIQIHTAKWTDDNGPRNKPTVVLLSGPTNSWNSDSAWFARLAPKLAKTHRVIAIDRAGQVLNTPNAAVGYQKFSQQLDKIIQYYQLKDIQIIAFASSNLTLNHYLTDHQNAPVKSVILIDPDVLLPYSMSRYKNDVTVFKKNLPEYLSYIAAGKYDQRAKEKNAIEMKLLKQLSTDDNDIDWDYVDFIFKNRLLINNLQNLFKEIADYDLDLDSAYTIGFPSRIPLTIIDTNFEQDYINKSKKPEVRKGLRLWREEAKKYYQSLTSQSVKGKYIALQTQEHLVPFSDPNLLIKLIIEE